MNKNTTNQHTKYSKTKKYRQPKQTNQQKNFSDQFSIPVLTGEESLDDLASIKQGLSQQINKLVRMKGKEPDAKAVGKKIEINE
jgi:hypothetical protein